jgi:tetratricopeptide (TPR) repeat protein
LKPRCFALLMVSLLYALTLFADDPHHHDAHGNNEKLGTVTFPISCAAGVQKPFERGLALLYSFEYEEAENQFKEVAAGDPKCAMAYWGQAMTLYHQLWNRTSDADLKQGATFMAKARQLKPATARERDYIEALALFYRDSEKLAYKTRVEGYAHAMGQLHDRYPSDREASVLYALALLSSGRERDPRHVNEKKAVGILNQLFDEQPDHPGIAHYIIHACDNPAMASLALEAARKYAAIAPSSPHAVHMPSHIFARLGLWQEDIKSNLAAIAAADKMEGMGLHVSHHKMHSMDFLQYAYLQIGDDAKAKAIYTDLVSIPRSQLMPGFYDYYDDMQANFPANYAIERRQWSEALKLQPATTAAPNVQVVTWWAHAVAAGHLHDAAAATDALRHYDELMETIRQGPKSYMADGLKHEHDVVQAWTLYAQGKNDAALKLLRSVADEQDKVGKGETEMPAREMVADMLLEMNRPEEALGEYEISLKTDPNRFNGLYGAARAAELAQQKQKAAGYYAQLLKNCEGSSSDRPELERARTLVAQR